MPYGSLELSTRRVWELALDLPKDIAQVEPITPERAPLYVMGPLVEGQTDAPTILPCRAEVNANLVRFFFDPPIGEGTYNVVVYPSRLRTVDGSPLTLVDERGAPWFGWQMTVVEEEPDVSPRPAPVAGAMSEARYYRVLADGMEQPIGASELSAGTLTVVAPRSVSRVELRLEPLTRGAEGALYGQYVSENLVTPHGPDGEHCYEFTAVGPIGNWAWAVYHRSLTEGRLVLNARGKPVFGEAVMAAPDEAGNVRFDLPVNHRIHVFVDGVRVWWGQTRLIPLLVSAERYALLSGSSIYEMGPADVADLRIRIMRASLEALALWGCALPCRPTDTMEEYVMTRLALGWNREDRPSGEIFIRLGDQAFRGAVNPTLEKRLQALADLLRACELVVPPVVEEGLYASHGKLSHAARQGFFPAMRPERNLVEPYSNGAGRHDYYRFSDSDQFARKRRLR